MQIINAPYIRSFADNPIQFLFEVGSMDESVLFELVTSLNGETGSTLSQWFEYFPYKETIFGVDKFYVQFDLSNYLSQLVKPLHPLDNAHNIDDNGWLTYSLNFSQNEISSVNIQKRQRMFACPGGIPLEMFQKLQSENQNFFQHVLESDYALIPLTVRNFKNNHLIIRQSELCDLVLFWHATANVFPNLLINGKTIPQLQAQGFEFNQDAQTSHFVFFDMKRLLEIIAPVDNIIIFSNENFSFEVEILPDIISEEKYVIEFRNSFGFIEKFQVTGIAEDENETTEAEKYQDNSEGVLHNRYLRPKYSKMLNVSSGYRLRQELNIIQDILLSDEVYFIDTVKDTHTRCLVTADNIKLEHHQRTPKEITLKIDFLFEESRTFGNINEKISYMENYLQTENSETLQSEEGEYFTV